MERFAFKIDTALRQNLYTLCRLCGIDHPDKQPIIDRTQPSELDDEPDMCRKIFECVGIQVTVRDQMPQRICTLCADKINDFYEYREMCTATNKQTRKLLGLPDVVPKSVKKRKPPSRIKNETDGESILGMGDNADDKKNIQLGHPVKAKKTAKSGKRASAKGAKAANNDFEDDKKDIKLDFDEILPVSKRSRIAAKIMDPPMVSIAMPSTSKSDVLKPMPKRKESSSPLLTVKTPNQRDRNRELEIKKQEKRKRSAPPIINAAAPIPLKQLKIELVPLIPVSCTICQQTFYCNTELTTHMAEQHVPIVYRFGCGGCVEGFTTLDELKDHNLWHRLSVTDYMCRVCDDKFATHQIYTRHTSLCKIPNDDRPVLPDVVCLKCSESFATKNLHDWHKCFMVNKGKCVRCLRRFAKKSTLFKHAVKCNGQADQTAPPADKESELDLQLQDEFSSVKCEPENMSDMNYHESHFADQNEDSCVSDEENETGSNLQASIKVEPAAAESDDSDDVIIVENGEPVAIVVDSSPTKRKQKKPKKNKKSKRHGETDLARIVKTEPMHHTESPSLPLSIKMEPLDDNYSSSTTESSSKKRVKKSKKKNKHRSAIIPAIKQEPLDDHISHIGQSVQIKLERIDFHQECDPDMARHIKTEREDSSPTKLAQPSLRLKITKKHGTLNAKMLPSSERVSDDQLPIISDVSSHKPPTATVRNKAAMLMARIRQEMQERQARERMVAIGVHTLPVITHVSSGDGTCLRNNGIKLEKITNEDEVSETSSALNESDITPTWGEQNSTARVSEVMNMDESQPVTKDPGEKFSYQSNEISNIAELQSITKYEGESSIQGNTITNRSNSPTLESNAIDIYVNMNGISETSTINENNTGLVPTEKVHTERSKPVIDTVSSNTDILVTTDFSLIKTNKHPATEPDTPLDVASVSLPIADTANIEHNEGENFLPDIDIVSSDKDIVQVASEQRAVKTESDLLKSNIIPADELDIPPEVPSDSLPISDTDIPEHTGGVQTESILLDTDTVLSDKGIILIASEQIADTEPSLVKSNIIPPTDLDILSQSLPISDTAISENSEEVLAENFQLEIDTVPSDKDIVLVASEPISANTEPFLVNTNIIPATEPVTIPESMPKSEHDSTTSTDAPQITVSDNPVTDLMTDTESQKDKISLRVHDVSKLFEDETNGSIEDNKIIKPIEPTQTTDLNPGESLVDCSANPDNLVKETTSQEDSTMNSGKLLNDLVTSVDDILEIVPVDQIEDLMKSIPLNISSAHNDLTSCVPKSQPADKMPGVCASLDISQELDFTDFDEDNLVPIDSDLERELLHEPQKKIE